MTRTLLLLPLLVIAMAASPLAQDAKKAAKADAKTAANADANAASSEAAAVARVMGTTADYQIGPEDVLDISVWKNAELSRKVPVRPDGKISLPLVNDIQAAGLTPTELRQLLITKFTEF